MFHCSRSYRYINAFLVNILGSIHYGIMASYTNFALIYLHVSGVITLGLPGNAVYDFCGGVLLT